MIPFKNLIPRVKVIGITGSIGSGKSAVGRILSSYNALVLDLDLEVHSLYESNDYLKSEIVKLFGNFSIKDGSVDRKYIADKVFKCSSLLSELENLVFPFLKASVEEKIEASKKQNKPPVLVAVEGALLFKWKDFSEKLDEVWVVTAPKDVRLNRLILRGLSREDASKRIFVQQNFPLPPNSRYVYIENFGTFAELEASVRALVTL